MDDNKPKMTVVAKTLIPLISIVLLAGCNTNSESGTEAGGNSGDVDGLYKAGENEVVIYYKRDSAAQSGDPYAGWGLHLWNGEGCESTDLEAMNIGDSGTSWDAPYGYTGVSSTYGAYYVLKVNPDASDPHECMNFILHKGDEKAFGSGNHKVQLRQLDDSKGLFGFHGSSQIYYVPTADRPVAIDGRAAHWLDGTTIGWEAASTADKVVLFYSEDGSITMNDDRSIHGQDGHVELTISGELPEPLKARYKHLASLTALNIDVNAETRHTLLKKQLVIVAYNKSNEIITATELQTAGVLDSVFASKDGGNAIAQTLGAIVEGNDVTFKLWAPTAMSVSVEVYNGDKTLDCVYPMTEDADTGIWSSDGVSGALNQFYRYDVKVYHPTTGKVEQRLVTDPYSLSVSANSLYSQVVDLDDTLLMPEGWNDEAYSRPQLSKAEDHVLYESHIRDFSFSDSRGTEALNGKYLALTEDTRESVTHLKSLQQAGLTTLHVLPVFDIATVDEINRVDITDTVGELCALNAKAAVCSTADSGQVIEDLLQNYDPASANAQSLMNDLRMYDSFNWGYDPFHYTVPEGSYATDAEGSLRIKEFRQMVKATHDMGLKFVMDVVYNHTNASGVNDKSVLDKIVPGYYHRLNANSGGVENSTCCDNTATENLMMGKLMVDSLLVWADDYKVDGFRFDLMGHQPKDLMVYALEKVKAIDPDTIFYGEGWDFGEVSNHARFEQATQLAMAGTEIGTFSDRLRDAVRGGSPFDGGVNSDGRHALRFNQGFGNAAYPNEEVIESVETTNDRLHNQDIVRLGMAGNLADYVLLDYTGETKRGKDVDYNGAPAGYTKFPSENISYVSKHDNQTLWDNNAYKIATGIDSAKRARMQTVSLSTVMLGQGIPFIHMGSELLRSKSMQRDSYDSGDWYNRVRFDGSDNNWNVGLPREDKDGANWDLIRKIIADPSVKPSQTDIELTKQQFLELLKIRSSSELFRLDSAEEVMKRVDFRNVGQGQTQGLIVMTIDDGTSAGADLDSAYDAVVVVVNSTAVTKEFKIEGASGFELHPVQKSSYDSEVKTASFSNEIFSVPALTTAVFVLPQGESQGVGLPIDNSNKDVSSIAPFGSTELYLRGSITTWDAPAENSNAKFSYIANNIYQLDIEVQTGSFNMKVADASWNAETNFGGEVSVTLGEASTLTAGSNDNVTINIAEEGNYRFKLDATNKANPTLTVTKL